MQKKVPTNNAKTRKGIEMKKPRQEECSYTLVLLLLTVSKI